MGGYLGPRRNVFLNKFTPSPEVDGEGVTVAMMTAVEEVAVIYNPNPIMPRDKISSL